MSSRQKAISRNRAKDSGTVKKVVKAGPPGTSPVTIVRDEEETPVQAAVPAKKESIRMLIKRMLTEGKTNAEITAVLQVEYAGTKAAEKSAKHISFYKSHLKREAKDAAAKAKA